MFFTQESAQVLQEWNASSAGKGRYQRTSALRRHVVVVGGAVATRTELLEKFLEEILHVEHLQSSKLDVVLMNPALMHHEIQGLLREEWIDDQLHYFSGSILR